MKPTIRQINQLAMLKTTNDHHHSAKSDATPIVDTISGWISGGEKENSKRS